MAQGGLETGVLQCLLHVGGGGHPLPRAGQINLGVSLDPPQDNGLGEALSFLHCCCLLQETTLLGQRIPVGLQQGRACLRCPGFLILSPETHRDTLQPSSDILPAPLCFLRACA